MPIYSYTNDDGLTVEKHFPIGRAPREITVAGIKFYHDLSADHSGTAHCPGNWPMVSNALGVNPKQIPEAIEYARRHGVAVDFTKDGKAKVDKGSRKAYARLFGMHDLNGGYGDP